MSLSALIKFVKEIVLFAINSMQFAQFILHFLIPFHILTPHVKYQEPVDVATLSNRLSNAKGSEQVSI